MLDPPSLPGSVARLRGRRARISLPGRGGGAGASFPGWRHPCRAKPSPAPARPAIACDADVAIDARVDDRLGSSGEASGGPAARRADALHPPVAARLRASRRRALLFRGVWSREGGSACAFASRCGARLPRLLSPCGDKRISFRAFCGRTRAANCGDERCFRRTKNPHAGGCPSDGRRAAPGGDAC